MGGEEGRDIFPGDDGLFGDQDEYKNKLCGAGADGHRILGEGAATSHCEQIPDYSPASLVSAGAMLLVQPRARLQIVSRGIRTNAEAI